MTCYIWAPYKKFDQNWCRVGLFSILRCPYMWLCLSRNDIWAEKRRTCGIEVHVQSSIISGLLRGKARIEDMYIWLRGPEGDLLSRGEIRSIKNLMSGRMTTKHYRVLIRSKTQLNPHWSSNRDSRVHCPMAHLFPDHRVYPATFTYQSLWVRKIERICGKSFDYYPYHAGTSSGIVGRHPNAI